MKLVPAILAVGASVASAQSSICSTATYTITSAAEATAIPCRTMESIEISSDLIGAVTIDGPTRLKGNLVVNNATQLVSLASSSLTTIDGRFELVGLELLNDVRFTALTAVETIEWVTLPALGTVVFGTAGVTSASSVRISNTDLRSLDGLNLASVDEMYINNNDRLLSYSTQLANVSKKLEIDSNGPALNVTLANLIWATQLANVSKKLEIDSNGPALNVTLANLIWAQELIINNAASVLVPSLEVINGSMRFDQNSFTTFTAPNLTEFKEGDISFINNPELTNISFPLLETLGGSLTIVNNSRLAGIDGFPELKEIGGAVLLGGDFESVELPSLDDARGAFDVRSTENIDESCKFFDDMEGRQIRGEYNCRGGDENANEANSTSGGSSGNGGSSNNNNNNNGSGSAMLGTNMAALVTVAVIGGLAQLML
ncbi:Protein ecm33 like protein [Verticillium longisporum]|uniref:Protein ecm33 like protein n=1 Tax=Verticillium longisporum TaxID=100787 RepID=A0A8I2ZTG0_VERLO|nr:Protein ecm33 like protein [Verticillium longisporum]